MKNNPNLSIYILCGGKSTRMGEDKGFVMYKGKSFMEWILKAAQPLSSSIFLLSKNQAYSQFGYPLITDLVKGKGPVGGIYTALEHSKTEWNLILSCDIPQISTAILEELILLAHRGKSDLVMVTDGKNDYPLVGIYQKKLSSYFLQAIAEDKLKLCPLVETLNPSRLWVMQDEQKCILNINSREDLKNLTTYDL